MIFIFALRNIKRNKKDNLIVVFFIAIITFLFYFGNTIIGNAELNIRHSYIESLTGDVVLQKTQDITTNLFGANTPVIDSFFSIPVLPAYNDVLKLVSAEAGISGISSQVSGKAYLDLLDIREPVLLCGIDASSYFSLFPGISLDHGRFLEPGEYGGMITLERAKRIESQTGVFPEIDMPLLFTSGSSMGFKIREAPLVGIFSYKNPGQFMDEIVIVDPQTVRVLNSIQVAGNIETDSSFPALLSADSDDIFSDTYVFDDENDNVEFSTDLLQNYLRETKTNSTLEAGGDWNFIILRLNKSKSSSTFISRLNEKLKPYGITAVDWRTASGISSILPLLIQFLFNSGVFLVSVAGILSIINILLISVFLRVREIGTIRTIGASDFFIRSLIYCENISLSMIAGLVGVCVGFLFSCWINSFGFSISNELLASIMGGPVLQIEFLPQIAVISIFIALFLGFAASMYPVETAVRIRPIVAVRQG